ncbi:MAG: hypothetical protein JJT89_02730 [Nitriliruptoraceae bacterium]|nr:hypothetical protein [Nitriliruptoraceae bacterium]
MSGQVVFRAWSRDALSALIDGEDAGRSIASLPLALHTERSGSEQVDGASVSFVLAGPRDVAALAAGSIVRRSPEPDTPDAEVEMQPFVVFDDPGLPWRYTPGANPEPSEGLRPWLALVVGPEDEVVPKRDRVTIEAATIDAHPLGAAGTDAHVQEADGTTISRLLSRRKLEPDTHYVAVVVPTTTIDGGGELVDAWEPGQGSVTLPCFDRWTFRTGPAGDFLSLAKRLEPYASPSIGRAAITYHPVPEAPELSIRGALAPVGSSDEPLPDEVADHLAALHTEATDDDEPDGAGRPVVGLPRYGRAWTRFGGRPWNRSIDDDPRHRGVAGIGARLEQDASEDLDAEVARQSGALDAASQRVRDLAIGLTASTSLWDRRLPDDPAGRLQILGPALRRVMTSSGSLRALATADDRPLPSAWFSTALRRALRPGPARTALAADGAIAPAALLAAANTCPAPPAITEVGLPSFDDLGAVPFGEAVGALDPRGDRPPPEGWPPTSGGGGDPTHGGFPPGGQNLLPKRPQVGADHARSLLSAIDGTVVGGTTMFQLGQRIDAAVDAGRALPMTKLVGLVVDSARLADEPGLASDIDQRCTDLLAELSAPLETAEDQPPPEVEDPQALLDLAASMDDEAPQPAPCDPVDTDALAGAAVDAFDPRRDDGLARRRVSERFPGLDEDHLLDPPALCPGLDVPVWKLLREHQPEWLLPGLGTVPDDRVLAVQTNAVFTDALLVGLNTSLVARLRRANVAMAPGCTPVRTFWSRVIDVDEKGNPIDPRRLDDIIGVRGWTTGDLGDPAHRPRQARDDDLVIVIRGALLERYPDTLVYLLPQEVEATDTASEPAPDPSLLPRFRGSLGPGITYLGFPGVDPDVLEDHDVVLEEPPTGFRFRLKDAPGPDADGGEHAAATFATPVRVRIHGQSLIPPEEDS